jgi:hypothetical protein
LKADGAVIPLQRDRAAKLAVAVTVVGNCIHTRIVTGALYPDFLTGGLCRCLGREYQRVLLQG